MIRGVASVHLNTPIMLNAQYITKARQRKLKALTLIQKVIAVVGVYIVAIIITVTAVIVITSTIIIIVSNLAVVVIIEMELTALENVTGDTLSKCRRDMHVWFNIIMENRKKGI